uniref:Uncharacterized protein n=1 Tax=Anguilla anguilla TaxID=7936 RepID=A0A0E9TCX1_ANGAN
MEKKIHQRPANPAQWTRDRASHTGHINYKIKLKTPVFSFTVCIMYFLVCVCEE